MIGNLRTLTRQHMGLHQCAEFLPGDLVLTASTGWVGRIIRWGTQEHGEPRTLFNHVGMVVDHQGTIVEALTTVEMHNIAEHYGGRGDRVAIFRPVNISYPTREQMATQIVDAVGQRYGYGKIALHVFDGILGKLPINLPPIFTRFAFVDSYPICSYLVARIYADYGLHFGINARFASPDDIGDFVTTDNAPYICIREFAPVPVWPHSGA